MRTRIAAAVITTAALLSLATACSSSSNGDKATAPHAGNTAAGPAPAAGKQDPAAADKAALVKSITDYTAEMFAGNPDGYNLMSARCRQQMTRDAWKTLVKTAHQQYGSQKATNITVDQLSGDLARVSYGAGNIPQFNRKAQPWAREDGTWRWDACEATS